MNHRHLDTQFAVIGAGPYGLAVASHLSAAGRAVRIFGKPMDFWQSQMPRGMWLRSPRDGTHIASPDRALSLDQFEAAEGRPLAFPLPVEDFVRYGQWFQRQALPHLDPRQVHRVARAAGAFRLTLEDGAACNAQRVIVATGIGAFPNIPDVAASLPADLASHSSDPRNQDLGRFAGKKVIVIGGGQSAIESAALLSEGGAAVEVVVRAPHLIWLRHNSPLHNWLHSDSNPLRNMLYSPGNIGPPMVNWLIEKPSLLKLVPRPLREWLSQRAIRPAASGWLRARTHQVAIHTGKQVVQAVPQGDQVRLRCQDGRELVADHVFLGTGYKINIARYRFLDPDLLAAVHMHHGYPVLNTGLESSAPGLYFVGATAEHTFGPICRFVAGTPFAAQTLTRRVLAKRL